MKTKSIVLLILFITSVSTLRAQATLDILVSNIKEVKGSILVSLFSDKSTFLKKSYQGKVVPVQGESAIVVFENVPLGEYALSIIHDANDNGELDSNFMGIPKEGFGFGNNALGTFGPPDYEKTLIALKKGSNKQSISLKYY